MIAGLARFWWYRCVDPTALMGSGAVLVELRMAFTGGGGRIPNGLGMVSFVMRTTR